MNCAACGIDDRTKSCELLNGSLMAFCQPCRVKFDEIIAATPIDSAEDRRAEEEAATGGPDHVWMRADKAFALRGESLPSGVHHSEMVHCANGELHLTDECGPECPRI